MTEHNHRRGTRRTLPDLGPAIRLKHGLLPDPDTAWRYPDKSMSGWAGRGALSGVGVRAGIANDFTDGHRGMAKAARGAKKYVRSRIRFHENAATRRLGLRIERDET